MRNKVELLAPAGSPEGIRAAVQSGAGAVYMGFGMFNARRNAQGFSHDEMADAIAYCRARDVKTNITLNILAGDRELEDALEDAKFLYEAGADALIVQDLGLARLIHAHAPDFALHASTQMTIHTLDAAKQARDIGFSRVVLSRECSREEIKLITEQAGVETEVFVHGALCMCYSGQCYLSAVIGQRSGNRGLCAQPAATSAAASAVAQGSHARRTRCRAFRLGCVLAQDRGSHEASGVRRYCNQGLL
ncbi:MAG: peptidase U32 family protein [Butyricicoccus sp.]